MFTSRDFLRVEYNVLSKNVTRDVINPCIHLMERGCTKLRNEIETQRTKRNEKKRNITKRKRNILKCETKRNATKRNLL
jgi:hypothetical protein